MKTIKQLAFLAIAAVTMTACDDSFADWASPQSNPQEDAITIPGLQASFPNAVDLNAEADSVRLISLDYSALPAGMDVQNLHIVATPVEGDAQPITLKALTTDGFFSAADIQSAVVSFYGPRPEMRAINAQAYANVVKDGQALLADLGKLNFSIIPKAPQISANYYIVGGPNDWAGSAASKELKFSHSGQDVYEDPVFTIVFNAAEGDTWFAIGDDEACDAIAAGEDGAWSKLFGTTKGNGNTDATGTLDRRYNLTDEGSFCVPAGAKKIKVVINMMERTYTITPVNIAENYYLIGGPGNWDNSKNQKFSHSSKDVFDDPVFTYVFEGSGTDMWFAFGDDEAIDAVGDGVWNKLFGTTGASEDLSGTFDRRYNLGGDHSFHIDGLAKYYRFTINMAEMTYEITPLNFAQYIYFIGATDGWDNGEQQRQRLYSPAGDGVYTGFVYVADPNGWGIEFKFQKVLGDWGEESQLNSNNMTDVTGDFAKGSDNFVAAGGEGVYYVTIDLGNLTMNGIKVNTMGIIGDFNSWGGDVEMTWNANDYCYEATGAGITANGWKFRINNDWTVNLGGATTDNLVANGDNLTIVGNTIKLYPTRRTNDNIYCTVE